jgi:hypothetical protein
MRTHASIAALTLACAGPNGGALPEGTPVEATWHRDVRPIVETACVDCHRTDGPAPFDLTVLPPTALQKAIVDAVVSQRMPPFPADASACQPLAHDRDLNEVERATFTAWERNAFAAGDPATFVARGVPDTVRPPGLPSVTLAPEAPYTANPNLPDDYHCLPLGAAIATDTFVGALEIVPDQTPYVHHALAYLVHADGVAAIEAEDAKTPDTPGYPCFGGVLPTGSTATYEQIGAFVPGAAPEVLAEDAARLLPAGSRVVLQMHYNTASLPAGTLPPADATRLALWTRASAPQNLVLTAGIGAYDFVVRAGDKHATATAEVAFGAAVDVISATGHMHTRGTSIRLEAVKPDGSKRCMLDIPTWDFDWQRTYAYPDNNPFRLEADETTRVTCTWDNSAANQPTVNGEAQEPRDLRFGEGTNDEMCLAFASYTLPYALFQGCEPIVACHSTACAVGDGDCLVACWEDALSVCGLCVAGGILGCGEATCQLPGLALLSCTGDCGDLPLEACLAGPCRAPLARYLDCQDANVRSGVCDPYLATCDVAFGP